MVLSFKYHTEDIEHLNRLKLFIRELFYKSKLHNVKHFLGDLYRLRKYLFAFGSKFILKKRIHQFIDKGIEVFVQSEQIPLANSQISVVENESLSNGLFKIVVDWNWNGREIEAIHEASVELKRYLRDQNIGDFEIDERIIKRDLEVLDSFQDTYHLCGGMRMSESDKYGVVDPNCRVWGTNNVWVAGAAVFPSSGHANSTLTALALSERIVRNSL